MADKSELLPHDEDEIFDVRVSELADLIAGANVANGYSPNIVVFRVEDLPPAEPLPAEQTKPT